MTTQFTPSTMDTTDTPAGGGADRELVAAARMLLARMNVDPADLMTDPADRPPVPTFEEYISQVEDAVSEPGHRVPPTMRLPSTGADVRVHTGRSARHLLEAVHGRCRASERPTVREDER